MAVEYKINLHYVRGELKEGQLVLVQLEKDRFIDTKYVRENVVGKVVKGGTDRVNIELPDLGVIEGVRPQYGRSTLDIYPVRELKLVGLSPLAADDPVIVHEYLDRLCTSSAFKATVFYVTKVENGKLSGRLMGSLDGARLFGGAADTTDDDVQEQPDGDTEEQLGLPMTPMDKAIITDEFPAVLEAGRNLSTLKPIPEVKAGDLLAARDFKFEFIEGQAHACITDIAVIGNMTSAERAVKFLGLDSDPERAFDTYSSLSSASVFDYEYSVAVARTEPDTALVVFYGEESTKAHVLGSSGYHAFINEDLAMYFEAAACKPGLWVMDNLRNHSWRSHEGEYDATVDGDWRPANEDDIERLFGSLELIDSELSDILEIDEEPGLAARYIELAHQAVFEDKFNIGHRLFSRHRMGLAIKDHERIYVEDVVNLGDMNTCIAKGLAAVEPEVLRNQIAASLKTFICAKTSLFADVVPTDEETEAFQAIKTWRKERKPIVFTPTEALERDIEAVASAVISGAPKLLAQIERGANFSHSSIEILMKKLVAPLSADGLKPFSRALKSSGQWYFVGEDESYVTLALFVEGVHRATLTTNGDLSHLYSPEGLSLTEAAANLNRKVIQEWLSMDMLASDAVRAVSEFEARRLVHGDYMRPLEDGIHETNSSIIYITDGVMHRTDGPAYIRRPRSDGGHTYEEYRFRGNLHRDDGPAVVEGDGAIWYLHGLEHRIDGPSTTIGEETEYRRYGRLDRKDGPAIDSPSVKAWYRKGLPHRGDGAAALYSDRVEYYRSGAMHRIDGPAIEYSNGAYACYLGGKLHNLDGPASVNSDGSISYAIDGEEMTAGEFEAHRKPSGAPTFP